MLPLRGIVSIFLLVGVCCVQTLDLSYSHLLGFLAGDEASKKKKIKISFSQIIEQTSISIVVSSMTFLTLKNNHRNLPIAAVFMERGIWKMSSLSCGFWQGL